MAEFEAVSRYLSVRTEENQEKSVQDSNQVPQKYKSEASPREATSSTHRAILKSTKGKYPRVGTRNASYLPTKEGARILVRSILHAVGMEMDFRDVMLLADADCVTPVTLKYKRYVILTYLSVWKETSKEVVPPFNSLTVTSRPRCMKSY